MHMSNLNRFHIFLHPNDLSKLKKIALEEQTSVSYLIRKAVKETYKNKLDDNPNNDKDRFSLKAKINL